MTTTEKQWPSWNRLYSGKGPSEEVLKAYAELDKGLAELNMMTKTEGFSNEAWQQLVKETIEQIEQLGRVKGGEYAAEGDRLDNFRRNGRDTGVPMETCWRIYAGKHWDSITTYVRDLAAGRTRERSEPIQGRADDLIVYLILFKAMCRERGQA